MASSASTRLHDDPVIITRCEMKKSSRYETRASMSFLLKHPLTKRVRVKTRFSLKHQCGNRFCLHKRVNWRTGKNSKTLWERPFPGDTRWLREGTESLTPAEYPWDNDYNRTWVQRRSLIQDYTAGRVRNITHQNTPKVRCNEDVTRT